MDCSYRKLSGDGSLHRGHLRRNGGAYILLSTEGLVIDRVCCKGQRYVGCLYEASEGALSPSAPVRSTETKVAPASRKTGGLVKLPPPTGSCLILDSRMYLDYFLARHLKNYQEEGVRFMYNRINREGGVILADEMGLGKTFQTICILYLFYKMHKRILIVTPCSLMCNWNAELNKWLPSVQLSLYDTSKKDIKRYFRDRERILIMNYEKLDMYSEQLKKEGFALIICDEAHRLKGTESQVLNVLKEFKESRKILITGTPVQNNLKEYFNLLSLIEPGERYEDFKARYEIPITKLQGIAPLSREEAAEGIEALRSLNLKTQKFLLKRKISRTSLRLPLKEELLYILKNHEEKEYRREYASALNENGKLAVSSIHSLRSCLVKNKTKVSFTLNLIASIIKAKKSTIFVTRYLDVLDVIVEGVLGRSLLPKADIILFNGSTKIKERQALIRDFNRPGAKLFMLTSKTGGEGLTLVKATEMIIYDTDWNPANDQQIMGRIWRIGQTNTVRIHRLFMMGTIEEHMLKSQLAKVVLQEYMDGERGAGCRTDEECISIIADDGRNTFFPLSSSIVHGWINCGCPASSPKTILGYTHEAAGEDVLFRKLSE